MNLLGLLMRMELLVQDNLFLLVLLRLEDNRRRRHQ